MKRIKQATKVINVSDIYIENNFIRIKGIIHRYTLYDASETTENNEPIIILRHVSLIRQLINEAILTYLNNGKISIEFNQYTF